MDLLHHGAVGEALLGHLVGVDRRVEVALELRAGSRLDRLEETARENGVPGLRRVSRDEIPDIECDRGYQAALADDKNAPRFSDRTSCEDIYGEGQCVPRGYGGSSFFTPRRRCRYGNVSLPVLRAKVERWIEASR